MMKPAETWYSMFERELLAVYRTSGISLKPYLTDHKPLTYALNNRSDCHSPHQAHHLDYITQFISDIRHVKGTVNTPADTLSRIETNALKHSRPSVHLAVHNT